MVQKATTIYRPKTLVARLEETLRAFAKQKGRLTVCVLDTVDVSELLNGSHWAGKDLGTMPVK